MKVVVAGTATHAFPSVLLRACGRRKLSRLNAFDLITTVTLGCTLSTNVPSRGVPFEEGIAALYLLEALQ